jgi:WD40 repeat protein
MPIRSAIAVLLLGLAAAPAPAQVDAFNDPLPPGAVARLGTVRWRHGGAVFFVGLADGGKQLVTASQDGWLHVWDAGTGKELRRFGKVVGRRQVADPARESVFYFGTAAAVALSADGRVLATLGNFDATLVHPPYEIRVWEVASGKLLWSMPWRGPNTGLAFTPDGKTLVAQGWEALLQWDTDTGKECQHLPPAAASGMGRSSSEAHQFLFSPDGKTLAGVVVDNEVGTIVSVVKIWDMTSGKLLHRITGQHGDFPCLAFSPDGKLLALPQSSEEGLSLWDVASAKRVAQFEGPRLPGRLHALAFSPDGKVLASRGSDRVLRLWDTKTAKELRPVEGLFDPSGASTVVNGHPGGVAQALVFGADGKVLYSASEKYLVRRWDVATGRELSPGGAHVERIDQVVFAPDGKSVWTRAADGLHRWDRSTGKDLGPVELPKGTALARLSPDGKAVAFLVRHAVHIWDLAAGKEIRQWPLPGPEYKEFHRSWLYELHWSAGGKVLAGKSYDQVLRLWETATGKEILELPADSSRRDAQNSVQGCETSLALSPGGTVLVRAESLEVVDLSYFGEATPAKPLPFPGVLHFHLLPGGARLRDVKARAAVDACAFAPDGRMLATLNKDNTLSLWEARTGKERCRLPGGTVLAFAPDGRTVAIGRGPVVWLWDVYRGVLLAEFRGHVGNVTAVAFAPDGRTLASGGADTMVLVWPLAR